MELTVYAAWLNDVFGLFDSFVLALHHELAVAYGTQLAPIAQFFDVTGHMGIMWAVLAVVLVFFRKTRMAGFAMLAGLAIGGGIAELIIKDIVARPRPFEMSDAFNAWWQFAGSTETNGASFPSGHVAGCTAALIALSYAARRWYVSLFSVIMIFATAIDRMYLQVHYPSDVLAGFILGFVCGVIGYAIVQGIWRMMGKHPDQIARAKADAARHAAVSAQQQAARQAAQMQAMQAQGYAQLPQQLPQQQVMAQGYQPQPAQMAGRQAAQPQNLNGQPTSVIGPNGAASTTPSNMPYTARVTGEANAQDPNATVRMPQRIEDLRR